MTAELNRKIFKLLEEDLTPIPDFPGDIDALLQAQQWADTAYRNLIGRYYQELGVLIEKAQTSFALLHKSVAKILFAQSSEEVSVLLKDLDKLTKAFSKGANEDFKKLDLACSDLIPLVDTLIPLVAQNDEIYNENNASLYDLDDILDRIRNLCVFLNVPSQEIYSKFEEIGQDSAAISQLINTLYAPLFNSKPSWPNFADFIEQYPQGFNEVSNTGVNASLRIRGIANRIRDNGLWDFGGDIIKTMYDCPDRHALAFRLDALANKIDELGITQAFQDLNDELLGVPSFVKMLQAESPKGNSRAA